VSLAERLGYPPHAKVLIVNCDDLGSSRSANVAVYEALRDGLATSATLMVPCPWARDAAAMYRGEDVGVHLTLNSEWDTYRLGPITHSPSLLDGDGGFPRTVEDVWDHADLDEVRKECRAQLERAIYWGFDVSHIDSHMGTMQLRPEFFDVYLELAVDFALPLRMAGASAQRLVGFPYRRLAEDEGVVFPDHFVYTNVGSRRAIEKALFDLAPGVTEVYLHPGIDSDELRASHPDWPRRVEDHAFLTRDPSFRDLIDRAGVTLIGYRALRDLQRATPRTAS
jgi:chitin disaccharide deacetylase